MKPTYRRMNTDKHGSTIHKLLTTATAACLLFGTSISALAQTEFQGDLKSVSITDAAGTNSPPTANFTYTQNGDTFTFDAGGSFDSDGSITEYKWDLGDGSGTTTDGSSATTTLSPGEHAITLTVTDNSGGVAITQLPVTYVSGFILEDAEDGTTSGWSIYDNDPAGATIANEFDTKRQSNVIIISGDKMGNGFELAADDGSNLNYTDGFEVQFSMKFSDDYRIYIQVETTDGNRYLTYTNSDTSSLGTSTYINHGLGSDTANGEWATVSRDLQKDLTDGQAANAILAVNKILVRGSGRIDDIILQ